MIASNRNMGLVLAVHAAAAVQLAAARGLYTLATIAHIAPLLAFLLALERIVSAFSGHVGEKSGHLPFVLDRLAQALAAAGFGILAGLLAHWSYRHLLGRCHALALEMQAAILELANALGR